MLFVDIPYFTDIYYKNSEIEKTIEQKTDEPFYYYSMAVILEEENKRKSREYLDIAMQYWSEADEDFILLIKANQLSKRLLIYNADES